MRFVASTILSVAILAFVTQSVSAVPVGATKNADEAGQESNVLLKRTPLYDGIDNIGTFGINDTSNTNVRDVNIDPADLYDDCLAGIVPGDICYALLGPGPL
jgi:hypothetical protein